MADVMKATLPDGDKRELVERLRCWTTDWNDTKMVPGEPPRDGIHCDIIDEAADALDADALTIAALSARVGELEAQVETQATAAYREAAEKAAGTNFMKLDEAYQAEKQARRAAEAALATARQEGFEECREKAAMIIEKRIQVPVNPDVPLSRDGQLFNNQLQATANYVRVITPGGSDNGN